MVGNLLAKHERRVDKFLKRLSVGTNDGQKALRRLDVAFLTVAAGTGVAKGVGTTARKNLKIPTRAITRACGDFPRRTPACRTRCAMRSWPAQRFPSGRC